MSEQAELDRPAARGPLTRGLGAGKRIVDGLTKHAGAMDFPSLSLVAVNGSQGFWEKQGFAVEERMRRTLRTLAGVLVLVMAFGQAQALAQAPAAWRAR